MLNSFEVNQVFKPTKEPKIDPLDRTFVDGKARHNRHPHYDTLVITSTLASLNMHRILVDNKSSMNLLYKQALDKIEIDSLAVRPVNTLISGFTGSPFMLMRKVILSLSKASCR